MWRWVLDACTVLGGLSALFYFADRVKHRQLPRKQRNMGRGDVKARLFVRVVNGLPSPPHVVLALQWVLLVYISGHLSRGLPAVAVLVPIWAILLGLAIHKSVVKGEGQARIVGGIAGGIIGAAIAYASVDWAAAYGLSTGMFFGTLVSGTVANPSRQTSLFSAIVSTTILLWVLGVFHGLRFFADLDGEAFIGASLALGIWLCVLVLVRLLAIVKTQRARNE